MAKIFGVEVKEIYIYPLGGISKFDMALNIDPLKEFLILTMGPIFQFIAYFILIKLLPMELEIIRVYHYSILGFNLLPIYPLDGGKLIKLLLDSFIPYKNSFKIVIVISYFIVLIIFLINNKLTINIIIMITFLVFLITKEKEKIDYFYHKFILERYLNNYKFKKSRMIRDQNSFYRNSRHIIKKGDKYYLEKEYLEKIYKN